MRNTVCFFLFVLGLMTACDKSPIPENEIGYSSKPETLPENDNSNFGVYRGVILGSSGTIIIRIKNGNDKINAYIDFEGFKDTLYTESNLYFIHQDISRLSLKGKRSSALFSVAGNGSNPRLELLMIDGKLRNGYVIHENSSEMISVYKGYLKTPDKIGSDGKVLTEKVAGVLNCIRVGNKSLTQEDGTDDFYIYAKFYDDPQTIYRAKTIHPMVEASTSDNRIILISDFYSHYLHKLDFSIVELGTDSEEVWGSVYRTGTNGYIPPPNDFWFTSKRIN